MQRISMCRVDDHVVGDVSVQRHLVVLGGCVNVHSAGVVGEVVVGDRQQLGVLDVEVDDADGRVVENADAAVLDVVRLERYARIQLADVLEHEAARLVPRHRVVRDSLQLPGAFTAQQHTYKKRLRKG